MATQDFGNAHGPSDAAPAAAVPQTIVVPPMIPPPLPAPSKRSRFRAGPVVISLVCVAGLAMFLTVGLLLWAFASAARETQSEPRVRPIVRETRSEPGATSNARAVKSEPGLSYTNDRVAKVPWSIHVLKIDRSRKDLTFFSAHARDKVLAVSMIADQARAVPREVGRALAGVNADFYVRDTPTYAGDPRGLQIVNGELISGPDTVCVWFDTNGNPHLDEVKGDFNVTWANGRKTPFGLNQQRRSNTAVLYTPTLGVSTRTSGGRDLILEKDGNGPWLPLQASQTYRARVRAVQPTADTQLISDAMVLSLGPTVLANLPEVAPGAVLQISTATTPDLKGVKAAIGGGPTLIKDGKAFTLKNPPPGSSGGYAEASKYQRHPRSAVGWSPTHIYLVTVDGRQPGLSEGMKLAELAEYFVGLGCTDAMNFDGGKSAQMLVNGQIVNSPCQGEDTVASSLLVVRKPEGR